MSLPIRRFSCLAIALSLAAPVMAQLPEAMPEHGADRKPLNLSLPREAAIPPTATTREDPSMREKLRTPSRPDSIDDPSPMDQRWGNRGNDSFAPYGTGFEARRRGMEGGGFGGAGGRGGGGRGGGRGR